MRNIFRALAEDIDALLNGDTDRMRPQMDKQRVLNLTKTYARIQDTTPVTTNAVK
jgi:hypothetical protein